MALAKSTPSHYGKLAVDEQIISPSILAAACSSPPLLAPTVPAAHVTRRRRHAFAAGVVLLVHGFALLPLLGSAPEPALSTAQPVMVGVMVAPPAQQIAAKTAAAPASVPVVPAPKPRPTAPTQRLPTASVTPAMATERSVAAAATQTPATREETATTQVATENTPAEAVPITAPPSYQAAYLANPQPPYPAMSRKLREEGTVRLHVMVSTDGRAETVKIKTSSGYERLDQAALAAVREWRFVPALQRGQSVAGWIEVPIQFRLEK